MDPNRNVLPPHPRRQVYTRLTEPCGNIPAKSLDPGLGVEHLLGAVVRRELR